MAAHPEKSNEYSALRRARKSAVETTLTASEWRETLRAFDRACAYCLRTDRKLTQDHMIPISRGGPHSQENVVPACGPCNSRKQHRSIFTMLGRY